MPLLLSMGEYEEALFTAVESGDTDLGKWVLVAHQPIRLITSAAYFVIMHLKEKFQAGELNRLIDGQQGDQSPTRQVIRDMFLQYCRDDDRQALVEFYFQVCLTNVLCALTGDQHDRHVDLAGLKFAEAYDCRVGPSWCHRF